MTNVITAFVNHHPLNRIFMDSVSASNFLSLDALRTLGGTPRDLTPSESPLVDFTGAISYPVGVITLPVSLGSGWKTVEFQAVFKIMPEMDPYHTILGRTAINSHRIVLSPSHQKAKFPTPHGVGEVIADQMTSR